MADQTKVYFQPVQPDTWPPSMWIAVPGQRAVPHRFWAIIMDPALPMYVLRLKIGVDAAAGGAYVSEFTVTQFDPPHGAPVTTARLRRIDLRRYLRLALDWAAHPATSAEADTGIPGTFWVETDPRLGPFGGPRLPGRRTPPAAPTRLDTVAAAYNAAKAAGQPVREAVMQACHVKASQAQRLIRATRDAGKLPPR